MKDLSTIAYNPISEKLTQTLCNKTQNDNPLFFRVLVSYYFGKVASTMRTSFEMHGRGKIPINVYAINLASSGHG